MSRLSFAASVLVSLLRSAVSAVARFLGPSWDGPVKIPAGTMLHARSRTEVAREADPGSRHIRRQPLRLPGNSPERAPRATTD